MAASRGTVSRLGVATGALKRGNGSCNKPRAADESAAGTHHPSVTSYHRTARAFSG